jgi:hypothetical protein
MITQERQGRQLIYAANFEAMNALVAYLTEDCCGKLSRLKVEKLTRDIGEDRAIDRKQV